jgi:imidazolonepropionase-like amidohydrolase
VTAINPADMLGLDHRIGPLAVGRDAGVVLPDGDGLEIMSRARMVLVDGRPVDRHDQETGDGVSVDPYRQLSTPRMGGLR